MAKKAGIIGAIKRTIGRVAGVSSFGLHGYVREPYAGAWQQNKELAVRDVLSYSPVFACVTLIASDIAKLAIDQIELTRNGVWGKVEGGKFQKLLRKPNPNQTRIQFIESWLTSKLTTGNTFVLIIRDVNRNPISLHVLDPQLVQVLCADDGTVFYELNTDNVSGIQEPIRVPSSEIIHDRFNCLFHPLQGLSPIYACAVAAGQGLAIQASSTKFFENGSQMVGVLSSPSSIDDETAERLKAHWESTYTGPNSAGKVAVAGDGLEFKPMSVASRDSQLVEQLGWTAGVVASVFHVPAHKIGVGEPPPYGKIDAVNQEYYGTCLQILIESLEFCLDDGLGLDDKTGVEVDTEQLLRMDSLTQAEVITKFTGAGILKLDEARGKIGRAPMTGGDTAYLQQQNYSVAALAKRDAKPDPFAKSDSTKPNDEAGAASEDGGEMSPEKWLARLNVAKQKGLTKYGTMAV